MKSKSPFLLAVILSVAFLTACAGDKADSDTGETYEASTTYEEHTTYVPGIYTSSLLLNDNVLDIQVIVNEYRIDDVSIVNLDEAFATMYPLLEPSFESLSMQICDNQTIDNITYSDENKYTSMVLLNTIKDALNKATSQEIENKSEKITNLQFTVLSEDYCPPELKNLINEKKTQEFEMTYQDNGFLYICVGYGQQETGSYSICVEGLYEEENAVYADTLLLNPEPGTVDMTKRNNLSYPVIVLKTEYLENQVVFK